MLKEAYKLSNEEIFVSFQQLASVQKVHRKTYLSQSRKYDSLELIYKKIKKNLERNIRIQIEAGLISQLRGNLMLWNHQR